MAKIIYGVSGEGSGHSSRAAEIILFIEGLGHDVKVVSYDRGFKNLKDNFDVFQVEGLHIASLDNKVSVVKTFTDNLKKLPDFEEKLKGYEASDNSEIKAKIKDLLADGCALAIEYHDKRMSEAN